MKQGKPLFVLLLFLLCGLFSPWRLLSQTNDTLRCGKYCFVSQPVPKEIEMKMKGCSLPDTAKISISELCYLKLPYFDFDGNIQNGEMVCNKIIARELLCIFRALFIKAYPINSIRLVDDFGADDETSMQANNTSCFNYRTIAGTNVLSNHAYGLAVDINPLQNPCVSGSNIQPKTAKEYVDRSKDFPHKIDEKDFCKKVFELFGYQWGGHWQTVKDYQHFEKRP